MRTPGARLRPPLALAALLCLLSGGARALTVEFRNVSDNAPAPEFRFGLLNNAVSHHTAEQYFLIGHSSSPFRRTYLYSDNLPVLGKFGPGLVSVGNVGPIPVYWRNYPSLPADGRFTPAEEALWSVLLDKSQSGFDAAKPTALLTPGPDQFSRVFLGVKLDPSVAGGDYRVRLVVEETSLIDDVTGPAVSHPGYPDLVLTEMPLGLVAGLTDQSGVVVSTFYYQLDGQVTGRTGGSDVFFPVMTTLAQDPGDPFRWTATAVLPPQILAEGTLRYYFTAEDVYGNASLSTTYETRLVPEGSPVVRDLPTAGGSVEVPVGDTRWPGLRLDFPPGSVGAPGRFQMAKALAGGYPLFRGQAPQAVYSFGPDGLRFLKPVAINLPYVDQNQDGWVDESAVEEGSLRIFWFDGIAWRYVGGAVDPAGNRVTAQVTHFSAYGLFPFSQAPSADLVRPAEKIITPNGDGRNDMAAFGANPADGDFEIEIYDARGARLRKLHNRPEWDGRDDDGQLVESGTYIYKFTGQGLTLTGMVAVAK